MQKLNRRYRRLSRLVLFGLAGWLVAEAARAPRPPAREKRDEGDGAVAPVPPVSPAAPGRRPVAGLRRPLTALAFAALFFAGASLTAVAGDEAATYLEDDAIVLAQEAPTEAEAESEPAADEAPTVVEQASAAEPGPEEVVEPALDALPEAPVAEAAAEAPAEQASPDGAADSSDQAAADVEEPAAAPVRETAAAPSARSRASRSAPADPRPESRPAPVPAVGDGGHAHAGLSTVWFDRPLADPTPRSLRLTPAFARRLRAVSRREGVHWSLLLAALRADGNRRPLPARAPTLARTARQLAAHGAARDPWAAVLAMAGRTAYADRAVALSQYYRAVGLRALVRGLRAEQRRLVGRLLADEAVVVYPGGRADLAAGRVDVRVVALIAYLRESFGQVTVSSLVSGHRIYSRPGVVSAHVYGAAVDVAVLGGVPVLGNQGRGSFTEQAVRDILLLPAEMLPRQVISLLGLGGPSFPLADHHDHIHVGY